MNSSSVVILVTGVVASVVILGSFFLPATKIYWKRLVDKVGSLPLVVFSLLVVMPVTLWIGGSLETPLKEIVYGVSAALVTGLVFPFITAETIFKL